MPFLGFDTVTLLTTIFWVWMLIDCLFNKHMRGSPGSRICWFLFIFFTHIVGALIYYFLECYHRNPVDAFTYYYQRITQPSKQAANPQPTYQPPPKPYADYQQGYQAQQQEPVVQKSEPQPYYSPPQQPQYEQPIVSYPEIPQQ